MLFRPVTLFVRKSRNAAIPSWRNPSESLASDWSKTSGIYRICGANYLCIPRLIAVSFPRIQQQPWQTVSTPALPVFIVNKLLIIS
ncbi:hypothetical protein LY78DRAFT_491482 [Colletotrichum sublineola]|nr:hypothetical protein LY78DRAFT_491482 [Colletotrichum sublineola]